MVIGSAKDPLTMTVDAYCDAWRHYADFAGRTARIDYWRFFVINLVIEFCLGWLWHPLDFIYMLIVFVPVLALTARRLHDTGRPTGWMILQIAIMLLFVIGQLVLHVSPVLAIVLFALEIGLFIGLVILMAQSGQSQTNCWGEPPTR